IVGRILRINEQPTTIIGVLPEWADFGTLQILGNADYRRGYADRGGQVRVEVWLPLQPRHASPRDGHPIFVMGRLASGATPGAAPPGKGRPTRRSGASVSRGQ